MHGDQFCRRHTTVQMPDEQAALQIAVAWCAVLARGNGGDYCHLLLYRDFTPTYPHVG